jgi:hypothetical protein
MRCVGQSALGDRGRRSGPLEGRCLGAAGTAEQLGAAKIHAVVVAGDRRDLASRKPAPAFAGAESDMGSSTLEEREANCLVD